MGYSLKKQRAQTRPLTFKPDKDSEDELSLRYRPNSFTPELEEARENARLSDSAGRMLKSYTIPLVAEWDLTDEYLVLDKDGRRLLADGRPVASDGPAIVGAEVCVEFPVGDGRRRMYNGASFSDELVPVGGLKTEERVVPITENGLHCVPMDVMSAVVKAIGEDMSPGEPSATASEGSFG